MNGPNPSYLFIYQRATPALSTCSALSVDPRQMSGERERANLQPCMPQPADLHAPACSPARCRGPCSAEQHRAFGKVRRAEPLAGEVSVGEGGLLLAAVKHAEPHQLP